MIIVCETLQTAGIGWIWISNDIGHLHFDVASRWKSQRWDWLIWGLQENYDMISVKSDADFDFQHRRHMDQDWT